MNWDWESTDSRDTFFVRACMNVTLVAPIRRNLLGVLNDTSLHCYNFLPVFRDEELTSRLGLRA